MVQQSAPDGTPDRVESSAHRAPMSVDELGEGPTIAAAVDLFFGDLRLAPRTKKTYWHGIAKFLRHLSQHEGIDPEKAPVSALRPDHVTSFAAMMPRFAPPPPDVKLSDLEEIVAFIDRLPREEKPQHELRRLKVRAMIRFLFRSGVRVSELCALRRRDIDLSDGAASIYRAKGGKSRTVHFDGETATALTTYWSLRGDPLRGAGALPAFSGRDKIGVPGSAISPRTVEHIVAGLAAAAGIESDVTPHSFRHGLATELVRRRVRESTVQTILGHASPATTRIYVHKSAVEVADEYQDAFGPYRPPRDSAAD